MKYVGVDGGGTKTRIVEAEMDSVTNKLVKISEKTYEKSGNYRAIGDSGMLELFKELSQDLSESDLSNYKVVAGFAGAGTEESWETIKSIFVEVGFGKSNIVVTSDADLVLRALEYQAILLIMGTGSIAMGRKSPEDKTVARAGGLGPRLGSNFSCYQLGIEVVDIAHQMEDGRIATTGLLKEILDYFKVKSVTKEVVGIINASEGVEGVVAKLAPMVMDYAKEGDPYAQGIIAKAVSNAASHVKAVYLNLNQEVSRVALWGGGVKKDVFNSLFLDPLRQHELLKPYHLKFETIGVCEEDMDPVFAAIEYAMRD